MTPHALSHKKNVEPRPNLGESGADASTRLEAQGAPLTLEPFSPNGSSSTIGGNIIMQELKRIPEGTIIGEIPLDAAKAFPTRIWNNTGIAPRIAYADQSNQEHNTLTIKLLPNGAVTAPHPQIVFYVKGPYHAENLTYLNSNPQKWDTWMEHHINIRSLNALIDALVKAQITHLRSTRT